MPECGLIPFHCSKLSEIFDCPTWIHSPCYSQSVMSVRHALYNMVVKHFTVVETRRPRALCESTMRHGKNDNQISEIVSLECCIMLGNYLSPKHVPNSITY